MSKKCLIHFYLQFMALTLLNAMAYWFSSLCLSIMSWERLENISLEYIQYSSFHLKVQQVAYEDITKQKLFIAFQHKGRVIVIGKAKWNSVGWCETKLLAAWELGIFDTCQTSKKLFYWLLVKNTKYRFIQTLYICGLIYFFKGSKEVKVLFHPETLLLSLLCGYSLIAKLNFKIVLIWNCKILDF